MQVQYRNCNYIGEFNPQSYERQGYGLLIFDNSHIIMAKWKSNSIDGPFVIITDRMRALGTMVNNMLQGYNVISIQQSLVSNKKQTQRTVYGMFKQNKLYGKALVIDGDEVTIAHYTDGKLRQISQKKQNRDQQVYNSLKKHFSNQIYTIAEWLTQIFMKASRQLNTQNSYKYQPTIRKFQEATYFYGYAQTFLKDNSFGFIMNQGEVISIGDHFKDRLQGIGRAYRSDKIVEDGVFKQGELCGIGISYTKKTHKFILGEHNQQNESFQKGFGFPQKQISQIRKQFHLRSIYFYNDIVLFPFTTMFEAICSNCLQFNIQHESPRFSSINNLQNDQKRKGLPIPDKSPLRAKISYYQEQSERIDEPSPIKNKPYNQYERIDNRRANYFQNDEPNQQSQDYRKQRSKSNSRRNFQPLNKQRQPNDTSNRSQNKRVKDTRQLVRQLQEKQRMKRGYLDQIYKQAKLYSRRN